MSKTGTIVAVGVGVAAIGGIMLLSLGGLHWEGFLKKQTEGIRYDIHKESQAYRDGMQRTLSDMKMAYEKATPGAQIGIKEAIRHQFSQTDTSEYPSFLQDFLRNEIGVY